MEEFKVVKMDIDLPSIDDIDIDYDEDEAGDIRDAGVIALAIIGGAVVAKEVYKGAVWVYNKGAAWWRKKEIEDQLKKDGIIEDSKNVVS